MKYLKILIFILSASLLLWACGAYPINKIKTPKEEPVVIANDSLQYEIIILDIL